MTVREFKPSFMALNEALCYQVNSWMDTSSRALVQRTE